MGQIFPYVICITLLITCIIIRLKATRQLKKRYIQIIQNCLEDHEYQKGRCYLISISYTAPSYPYMERFVETNSDNTVIILLTAPEWLCEALRNKYRQKALIYSTQLKWLEPFRNHNEIVLLNEKGRVFRTQSLAYLKYQIDWGRIFGN